MDLTWLGHACFRMRGRDGLALADPPDPKSGHALPKTEAAIVTISHEHPGHSSLKSVGGEPVVLRGPGEYEVQEVLVTGIGTFHDDSKGSARGPNTVFAIRLDDLVICTLAIWGTSSRRRISRGSATWISCSCPSLAATSTSPPRRQRR